MIEDVVALVSELKNIVRVRCEEKNISAIEAMQAILVVHLSVQEARFREIMGRAAENKEPAQQHLTQQCGEPSEICD